jgi:hypothetical protein
MPAAAQPPPAHMGSRPVPASCIVLTELRELLRELQTCSAETSLDDLVHLFIHGGLRIVHVLDSMQTCIASVTLDDVINELLRF